MNGTISAKAQKRRGNGSPCSPVVAKSSPSTQSSTTSGGAPVKSNVGGWCKGLGDCLILGPKVSRNIKLAQAPPYYHLQKVEEIEKELEQEKEMKSMYKMRLERTQNYLRYCLQVAQDNGFLDLIINNKEKQQESTSPPSAIIHATASPQTPPQQQPHSDITYLIHQAKLNGWYIEPHEIEVQEEVAQGSTARIYRGRWRGYEVAVKCIFPEFFFCNDNGISFFAQEVETLSRQRHRFVLQLMGACLDPPHHGWIVTELLAMTLKDWLHGPGKRRKQRVVPLPPFKERLGKAMEIAQGMQYLHEHKPMVIHRDLKPSNIFLDDSLHVRIADFGHARFLNDEDKALTGETGTYVYMAPEVIRSEPYDEKSDVYSFGIILNELVTGAYPYIGTDFGPSRIALEVAEKGLRPELPEQDEQLEELIQLIRLSWDEDVAVRPSFGVITSNLKKIQEKILLDNCSI
ncbi:serine/threonine-protein kinase STY46-like [Lycium ferocissimum]|uniref:serine/threonine-protein kinase STY46-like n=1 Tax=Lycium ferocissimum TaxID=112874 RepID=UPI00281673C8|nr:serine/threonine-protein kinase STY46-like [Lycium ferocissimum]